MTVSSHALFLASVVACALFLRQIRGQGNTSDNESTIFVESFTTSWTTAPLAESTSTLNTSTTSDFLQSNAMINGTVEGGPLSFNGTNGTSVPLVVVPTSAPTEGSAGGGSQRFDVASFIGGIILAAGVIGLGVFIVKVYQSRQSEYSNI